MTTPLIAVAVLKNGKISGHAGRTVNWDVYAVDGAEPVLVWNIKLKKPGTLHEWHVNGNGERHPLHSADVAICGSGGEGVTRRLAERDTKLITTAETDPVKAIKDYLNGTLAAGLPHDEADCLDPDHHKEVSGS